MEVVKTFECKAKLEEEVEVDGVTAQKKVGWPLSTLSDIAEPQPFATPRNHNGNPSFRRLLCHDDESSRPRSALAHAPLIISAMAFNGAAIHRETMAIDFSVQVLRGQSGN